MPELSTDALLFGVVIAVGFNRVFQASGFKSSRLAYVVAQVVNLGFVVALSLCRIPDFANSRRVDLGIRVFLMCFIAWHMVRNSQARGKALAAEWEAEEAASERRERMAAFEAAQAGAEVASPGAGAPPESER